MRQLEIVKIAKFDEEMKRGNRARVRSMSQVVRQVSEDGVSLSHGIVGFDPTQEMYSGEPVTGLRVGENQYSIIK